jgi:hypothetical protein
VVWLAFEVVFVYFVFPETANHTLEELAFRMFHLCFVVDTHSKALQSTKASRSAWNILIASRKKHSIMILLKLETAVELRAKREAHPTRK